MRVTDLPLSLTHQLGQVASPKQLVIDFGDDGCCDVQLVLKRQRYELNPDGSLAEAAGTGYATPADVLLIANATCAVDLEGMPCYRLITETRPASARHPEAPGTALNCATGQVETFGPGQDWPAYLNAKPERLLLQNRAFGISCAHEPVTIWELVEKYIALADVAPSRFL
ncbi:MAG: hypothetical protein ACRYFX_12940 [Janthinobacterium lividum]